MSITIRTFLVTWGGGFQPDIPLSPEYINPFPDWGRFSPDTLPELAITDSEEQQSQEYKHNYDTSDYALESEGSEESDTEHFEQNTMRSWEPEEDFAMLEYLAQYGKKWKVLQTFLPTRRHLLDSQSLVTD